MVIKRNCKPHYFRPTVQFCCGGSFGWAQGHLLLYYIFLFFLHGVEIKRWYNNGHPDSLHSFTWSAGAATKLLRRKVSRDSLDMSRDGSKKNSLDADWELPLNTHHTC